MKVFNMRTFNFKDFNLPNKRSRATRLETDMGNRYICEVLEEIKTCNKTRNYGPLLSLVEEIQTLVNRMETALSDKRDVLNWEQRRPIVRDEIKELEWKKEQLEEDIRKFEFKIKEIEHDNKIK